MDRPTRPTMSLAIDKNHLKELKLKYLEELELFYHQEVIDFYAIIRALIATENLWDELNKEKEFVKMVQNWLKDHETLLP